MSWNLEAARILKEFTFDAGLFAVLIVLTMFVVRHASRLVTALSLAFLLALFGFYCSPFGSQLLGERLRNSAEALELGTQNSSCLETFRTVVVLGSGIVAKDVPTANAHLRVKTAAEFLNANSRESFDVILSGGHTNSEVPQSEAEAMGFLLSKLLTPDALSQSRIQFESQSLNTHESAMEVRKMANEMGAPLRVILVTSDVHMLRATRTFRGAGFRVCVKSAQTFDQSAGILAFSNGGNTVSLLNENVGLLGYWLKGWLE